MSARSALTALSSAFPEPFTTLFGMATMEVCTRPFGDTGPALTLTMPGMSLAPSVFVIDSTFAESAAVSFPPSARENTMMAAELVTCPVCGKAWFCRSIARIDS
jgi:hypothetical protein